MTQDVTTTSLTKSTDGGKTWTSELITDKKLAHRNGSAARHAGIHAPIVELNDGRLMSFRPPQQRIRAEGLQLQNTRQLLQRRRQDLDA
jgi:hypothetical protein